MRKFTIATTIVTLGFTAPSVFASSTWTGGNAPGPSISPLPLGGGIRTWATGVAGGSWNLVDPIFASGANTWLSPNPMVLTYSVSALTNDGMPAVLDIWEQNPSNGVVVRSNNVTSLMVMLESNVPWHSRDTTDSFFSVRGKTAVENNESESFTAALNADLWSGGPQTLDNTTGWAWVTAPTSGLGSTSVSRSLGFDGANGNTFGLRQSNGASGPTSDLYRKFTFNLTPDVGTTFRPDTDFRFTFDGGSPLQVPEPSRTALCLLAALSVLNRRRRR